MKEDGSGSRTQNNEYIEQANRCRRDSEALCSEWKLKLGCFVVVGLGKLSEIRIDQLTKQPTPIGPCRTLKTEDLWCFNVGR
jgi:hypothetical protein